MTLTQAHVALLCSDTVTPFRDEPCAMRATVIVYTDHDARVSLARQPMCDTHAKILRLMFMKYYPDVELRVEPIADERSQR